MFEVTNRANPLNELHFDGFLNDFPSLLLLWTLLRSFGQRHAKLFISNPGMSELFHRTSSTANVLKDDIANTILIAIPIAQKPDVGSGNPSHCQNKSNTSDCWDGDVIGARAANSLAHGLVCIVCDRNRIAQYRGFMAENSLNSISLWRLDAKNDRSLPLALAREKTWWRIYCLTKVDRVTIIAQAFLPEP